MTTNKELQELEEAAKDMTTPWIPCDCCDDFACTIHEQHAWECTCPTIDVWAEAGHDPYLDDVTPELKAWVADNPIQEED